MKYQHIVDNIMKDEVNMTFRDRASMPAEVRTRLRTQSETTIGYNLLQANIISTAIETIIERYQKEIEEYVFRNDEKIDTEAFFEGLSQLFQYSVMSKYTDGLNKAFTKLLEDKNGIPKSRNIKH